MARHTDLTKRRRYEQSRRRALNQREALITAVAADARRRRSSIAKALSTVQDQIHKLDLRAHVHGQRAQALAGR